MALGRKQFAWKESDGRTGIQQRISLQSGGFYRISCRKNIPDRMSSEKGRRFLEEREGRKRMLRDKEKREAQTENTKKAERQVST
jgi:hypothetical protein